MKVCIYVHVLHHPPVFSHPSSKCVCCVVLCDAPPPTPPQLPVPRLPSSLPLPSPTHSLPIPNPRPPNPTPAPPHKVPRRRYRSVPCRPHVARVLGAVQFGTSHGMAWHGMSATLPRYACIVSNRIVLCRAVPCRTVCLRGGHCTALLCGIVHTYIHVEG